MGGGIDYLGDARQRRPRLDKPIGSRADLVDVAFVERVRPSFWAVLVIVGLPDCWTGDFLGKVRVGLYEGVVWGVLP